MSLAIERTMLAILIHLGASALALSHQGARLDEVANSMMPSLASDRRAVERNRRHDDVLRHREELIDILHALGEPGKLESLETFKQEAATIASGDGFYVEGATGWQAVRQFFGTYSQKDVHLRKVVEAVRSGGRLPPWSGPEVQRIVDFDRQLREKGIDLIVVFHPFKVEVYPSEWLPGFPENEFLFPEIIPLAVSLMDAGVEVLYLLPSFFDAARHAERRDLFVPSVDVHWAEPGITLAAKSIAERLDRYDFSSRLGAVDARLRRESDGSVFVGEQPYTPDWRSPVVVIGDSFVGTGLPSYGLHASLAAEIGTPTAPLWLAGGGLRAPRTLAEMGPEYLEGRRVVIWNLGSALLRPLHRVQLFPFAPLIELTGTRPELSAEESHVYARVEEVSALPDPEESLYEDAITVIKVRVRNVERGPWPGQFIRVAHWVMWNRRLLPASQLQVGDRVMLCVRPFGERASAFPAVDTAQRTDDIRELDLPLYWIDSLTMEPDKVLSAP